MLAYVSEAPLTSLLLTSLLKVVDTSLLMSLTPFAHSFLPVRCFARRRMKNRQEMIWASHKARRGRIWRGWRLTRCRDNSQTPHQPHPTNTPPPTPPFHLSRARSLQRRQEGDQGERASRHSWEGRWAISLSRLARMGLMCGSITKRRSAWHEQFHVHIVLLFRGVLTSP